MHAWGPNLNTSTASCRPSAAWPICHTTAVKGVRLRAHAAGRRSATSADAQATLSKGQRSAGTNVQHGLGHQTYARHTQQLSNGQQQQQQQQQERQPRRQRQQQHDQQPAAEHPQTTVTPQQQPQQTQRQQLQRGGQRQTWSANGKQSTQQQPSQQQQQQQQQQPPQQEQARLQRWQGTSSRQQQQQQRQQARAPVQLFQGPPASATDVAAAAAPLLTQRITRSSDWRELQRLLQEHSPSMNAIHVSAMLHTLSKLCGAKGVAGVGSTGERNELAAMLEQLMEMSLAMLREHRKQELSSNAGALARLGYYRPDYIAAIVAAAEQLLGSCSNQELANLGWGLARLGHVPEEAWLEAFQNETLARMSDLNAIELANSLWAHAKWGIMPPEAWLAAMFGALLARSIELQPPQLASVLWALAMTKVKPPPELLDSLLLESQVKLASFNSQGYATLAWSVCRMDLRPRKQWLEDYVRHTHRALHGFDNDQCFTNVSWALSKWEHRPPEPWLRDFCRAAAPFIPRMDTLGLSILSTSLADLRHSPPMEWTSFLLEELHRKRRSAAGSHVAAVLWAASRLLRGREGPEYEGPEPEWVQQYSPLLQDLVDGIAPALGTLPIADLVDIAVGLSDLHFFPGSAWMDAHESASNARIGELSAYQFGLLKRAYTRLDELYEAAGGVDDVDDGEGGDGSLESMDDGATEGSERGDGGSAAAAAGGGAMVAI